MDLAIFKNRLLKLLHDWVASYGEDAIKREHDKGSEYCLLTSNEPIRKQNLFTRKELEQITLSV